MKFNYLFIKDFNRAAINLIDVHGYLNNTVKRAPMGNCPL